MGEDCLKLCVFLMQVYSVFNLIATFRLPFRNLPVLSYGCIVMISEMPGI